MKRASRSRSWARVAAVAGLVCASVVATTTPASALFHLMMVTEVFAGTSTVPDAHFVEMQMHSDNQRFLTGHEVAVFDAVGKEIDAFTFSGPVANGANQSYVLIATEQAEAEFGIEADLVMTPVLVAQGGSVCFRSADGGNIDCASWGNYSGDDTDTGTPFNATLGLVAGQSMTRVTTGGDDPQALDAGDDTNDSAADFGGASPSPTNNAGGGPEPGPETIDHGRSLTLVLRRALIAKGTVSAEGDYEACFADVVVKIQRRSAYSWKVIASPRTNGEGAFAARIRDRAGRYRAIAPAFSPQEGHRCLKGTSPVRRNS